MAIKLFDSELKVMDVLWKEGDKTAKQISDILKEEIGLEHEHHLHRDQKVHRERCH